MVIGVHDTVKEKLDAIEASDLSIAFDGCHKVYLVDKGEEDDARDTGYDLFDAKEIRAIVNRSCGLVFVSAWNLGKHPWEIAQGEMPEDWYGESGVNV